MPEKTWFIYVEGDTFGPFTQNFVAHLLEANRLRFTDFGWTAGHSSWTRLLEVPTFRAMMPSAPNIPLPGSAHIVGRRAGEPAQTAPTNPSLPPTPKGNQLKRRVRVPIEGTVYFTGSKHYSILNISETGLLFLLSEETPLIGKEVKFKIESPEFLQPLQMTGILIREEQKQGTNVVGIEFTRINPAHARLIKAYVETKSTLAA